MRPVLTAASPPPPICYPPCLPPSLLPRRSAATSGCAGDAPGFSLTVQLRPSTVYDVIVVAIGSAPTFRFTASVKGGQRSSWPVPLGSWSNPQTITSLPYTSTQFNVSVCWLDLLQPPQQRQQGAAACAAAPGAPVRSQEAAGSNHKRHSTDQPLQAFHNTPVPAQCTDQVLRSKDSITKYTAPARVFRRVNGLSGFCTRLLAAPD